jgi:hypothetical protein
MAYPYGGINAVSLGTYSASTLQQSSCVAVGYSAGRSNQGANSIAIGAFAGDVNQAGSTIVINATGASLAGATSGAVYVAPMRYISSGNVIVYNSSTNEVSYSDTLSGALTVSALHFSTLNGSTITTDTLTLNSTLSVSTATTRLLNYSSLVGSTITADTMILNSTLSVSTATTGLLNYSSLVGSTITADTMTLNSTLSVSTVTTGLLNYSSLVGSTIIANTITSNSTIFGSTITTTGNVGIGTTNPSASLDVNGNLQLTQSLTIGTSGQFVAGSIYSDTNWGMIFRAKQANPGIAEFMWANSLNSELMRITSSGNVGIGSTNPSEKLDVNGSILANGIYSLVNGTININGYVSLQSGGPANTGYIEFRRAGGTRDGYIGFSNTADFFFILEQLRNIRFFIGGTEHMVIATSGNVGIGTTNPNQGKLQVSGRTILGYISGSKGGFLIDNEDYTGSFPAIQGITSALNVNSILFNPYGGNVGIGSTTPNYTLDVRGTNRVYGYSLTNAYSDNIFFNVNAEDSANGNGSAIVYSNSIQLKAGDLTWAGPTRSYGSKIYIGGGYSAFGAINHSYISMETAGSERMRISAAGNVGIGTISPISRFTCHTITNKSLADTYINNWTDHGWFTITDGTGLSSTSPALGIKFSRPDGAYPNGAAFIVTGNPGAANGGMATGNSANDAPLTFKAQSYDMLIGAGSYFFISRTYGYIQTKINIKAYGVPSYDLQLGNDSAAKPSSSTWTVSSDERLKTNIVLADTSRCYDIVKSLPLKRYTWKDDVYTTEQVSDRSKLGWIAQDVEQVFPKAVKSTPFRYNQKYADEEKKQLISEDVIEDCRSLDADQLYAVMYGAIQKLIIDKESLVAEKQALSNKLDALIAWASAQGYNPSA